LKEGSFSKAQCADSENLEEDDFFNTLPDFRGISDLGVEESLAKGLDLGGSFTFFRDPVRTAMVMVWLKVAAR
jgi:hypothetical protein